MGLTNKIIDLHLKLKQYNVQFFFLFFFWVAGFTYFSAVEPTHEVLSNILIAFGIRSPNSSTDFASFYNLIWPILIEVVFFGFITGELLEKYNPTVTCSIIARYKRKHAVVIGYDHLGERIVDYCIENKRKYVVMEDDQELVEDLINAGEPVVVGSPVETNNLKFASVKRATEVFICLSDVRIVLICSEKIRQMNPYCKIYARCFEEHVQEYLKEPRINAFPFSTSKWTLEELESWDKDQHGTAIVLGTDNLSQRVANKISAEEDREVYFFNVEHQGIKFKENKRLHIINMMGNFVSEINSVVKLKDVTQIFICWRKESEFDDSLYLTSKINMLFPEIKLYVRIFDDELSDIMERYNATTFSSSSYAFKKLQSEVDSDSAIFPHLEEKENEKE
ncbi:MAG: hypothetical protein GF364_08485 [Candidatus Lokiarchaeota archaeon]|nr:hypothetical protein [Candidatus Lokiarchaeota archaeon]